jgi:phosphoglucomutase
MDLEQKEAFSRMILSASGWRGVFAVNGDEESAGTEISEAQSLLVAAAAKVFSDYLDVSVPGKKAIIVGRDTRPTGEAIADTLIRSLLALGHDVLYTGIAAGPEIMAYARNGSAAGFMYISASHNPIGHNGIKFGLGDGGILQADESAKLISAFNSLVSSNEIDRLQSLLDGDPAAGELAAGKLAAGKLAAVYAAEEANKKAAIKAYRDFSSLVISGFKDPGEQESFFGLLKRGIEQRPLVIAVDFNGSARTVSIDRRYFASLGARFFAMNDKPGQIAHCIVPEGIALEPCRAFVEELYAKERLPVLAYVPDCDGDRGNLVFFDEREQRARMLEAQELFALACMAELSFLVWAGELDPGSPSRAAIVCNDPSSIRVDRIAASFGVKVFRAEVGEANVVGLARKLREQGYLVRFLGEGSIGGTIVHPSAVRDPVNTIFAIIKLLTIREGRNSAAKRGLFEIWSYLSGQMESYKEDFNLADIIATLPAFVSTGVHSEEALLKVKTGDQGLLKENYQKIFLREWEEKKGILNERFGLSSWEAIAYNGTEEKRGLSRFGEAGPGGLKIEFGAADGEKIAFIWMRSSKTESVFRILADAPNRDLERYLIEWQGQMVLEAAAATP